MHADQHVLAVADVPLHQRDVRFLVEPALERGDAELAVIGRQRRGRDAADERLGPHPVLDQIRDGDHRQLVPLRELRQLRHARHRPVLVHDFADHAGRIEPGDAREVDRRFGLAGAHEHAAVARAQRRDVPGPDEVRGPGLRIDGRQDRGGAIGRGNPGRHVILGVDRDAEGGAELRRVVVHRERQLELVEALAGHRQADLPAAFPGHEVDDLGRDLLRRDGQVPLVLAVLVVDDDDHAAVAEGVDGLFDGGERRAGLAVFVHFLFRRASMRRGARTCRACRIRGSPGRSPSRTAGSCAPT